ncbi:hypothetical protein [Streptomyces morookaense]|uniref:Uncharacterized protein n=1 Tax=Streptomyces morookaense TaxID=1970 RepID=A0A7Y7E6B2_STRMO|nr:hypothetical protein [Streptomyces morookaense]NVK77129.1 hypothetical protein [Streptomyces morookaense]GHF24198.1 hypothetical protein GCM10010359_28040 [Streptomyces morookaense]
MPDARRTVTIQGTKALQQPAELFTPDFQLDKSKIALTKGTAEGAASLAMGQGTVFATAGGDVTQAAQSLSRALLP